MLQLCVGRRTIGWGFNEWGCESSVSRSSQQDSPLGRKHRPGARRRGRSPTGIRVTGSAVPNQSAMLFHRGGAGFPMQPPSWDLRVAELDLISLPHDGNRRTKGEEGLKEEVTGEEPGDWRESEVQEKEEMPKSRVEEKSNHE
ncbi:hypothetical protein NDU88_006823 [Pleurodeles waltl]|uniref:Uncharacterized protein n=1 Tax=Pleurodeles waltl TaxID=8319 RepID=A0AAV7RNK7_PLEWA|nr:hypothetical protein NDU88_006823 [Pleurodeles waltl]